MKSNGVTVCVVLLLVSLATHLGAEPIPPDLIDAAIRQSPEYTNPVLLRTGDPVAVSDDLNGDGKPDLVMITVLSEPSVPSGAESLRHPSRLFRRAGPEPLFVVETYFAGDQAVQTVELGRRPALGNVNLFRLTDERAFPVAVTVTTRDRGGSDTDVLVFSEGGTVQRFTLRESEQERHWFADMDGDLRLDVVLARRVPEAGRGFETFIEILTLDGKEIRTIDSFPVVRELNSFLDLATEVMLRGEWSVLEELIDGPDKPEGPRFERVFLPAFGDADENRPFDYDQRSAAVTAVVFPSVMENPFVYPFLGSAIDLVFRVECCESSPQFFRATVKLFDRPNASPRYGFLTSHSAEQ